MTYSAYLPCALTIDNSNTRDWFTCIVLST